MLCVFVFNITSLKGIFTKKAIITLANHSHPESNKAFLSEEVANDCVRNNQPQ